MEAHAVPECPWTKAMFFVSFLGMLVIEGKSPPEVIPPCVGDRVECSLPT